jgi:hypothetical protein
MKMIDFVWVFLAAVVLTQTETIWYVVDNGFITYEVAETVKRVLVSM